MIKIFYEEYTNDYTKRFKDRTFYNLKEFENWFFSLCKDDYKHLSIPEPGKHWTKDGPGSMECNCIWTENKIYKVHIIEKDGGIIFSDGRLTNGQRHWNEEAQQLCRDMLERKKNPKFNFV